MASTTTYPVGTTILRSEALFALPVGTVLVNTINNQVFRVISSLTEGFHVAAYETHQSTPGYVLTPGDAAVPAVIPAGINLVIIHNP
jgi:hypothetical protein